VKEGLGITRQVAMYQLSQTANMALKYSLSAIWLPAALKQIPVLDEDWRMYCCHTLESKKI